MSDATQDRLIGAAVGIALSALLAIIALPTVVSLVENRVNESFSGRSEKQGLYATDGVTRIEQLEKRVKKLEQGADR